MDTIHYASTLVRKTVSLLVLLSFCTGASAEVFKCVDKATGKMSFTDKACPNDQPGAHHSVSTTNADSGYNSEAVASARAKREIDQKEFREGWQSQNAEVDNQQALEQEKKELARRKNQKKWDNKHYPNSSDGHGSYQTTRPTRVK